MSDYRSMFDARYLAAYHLIDQAGTKRDVVVTIGKVEPARIKSDRGEDKKPLVYFDGKDLPLVLNKTNGKAIATLYGNDTRKWIGKSVILYATTTSVGGKETDCIRVRPQIPEAPTKQQEKSSAAS